MSKLKTVFVIFIPVLVLVLLCTVSIFSARIPKNPSGTTGNTAGNLNNGGLFCQDQNVVYFSNAYDEGCLYSMNPDETQIKKLTDASVRSLNAAGDYLYYYQEQTAASESFASLFRTNGIYRLKKNGRDASCLRRIATPSLALCDSTLFYLSYEEGTAPALCRVDIDRKNPSVVTDFAVNPACIEQGLIYFGGTKQDHFLYTLDSANNSISPVFDGNIYQPILWQGYVYYMDISSDYRLCRYSLSQQQVEVLTEDRLDFYNIAGDMIYYQKSSSSDPALKRMMLDGSQNEVVAHGVYENINATSEYVYFNAYDAPTPVYHTPLYGSVNVSTFTAAAEAALKEIK